MDNTIEIPIRNSEEVIELECSNLPEPDEVLQILIQEKAQMKIWIRLALEYWRQDRKAEFQQILEAARNDAGVDYIGQDKDTMKCLDTLAAYNVILGKKEIDKERQTKYFMEATQLYTLADKVIMYDQNHLLGRACFCLLDKGDQLDQADNQFNFVLDQDPNSIPALLGKACIAFNKRDYKGALGHYKKCIRLNPECPADVRLGIGLCYYKMNKMERAVDAFTRALNLDGRCVGALIGLAVINLNQKDSRSIRDGIQLLSTAYKFDNNQALVLVHLANHFFFKKDMNKVQHLANHAIANTEHQQIRAEACYQLGRCYHVQGDYDQAFKFYYQATQFSSPKYALPFYYMGLMYLQRGEMADKEQAIQCFEKILKEYPNEHDTMKILGHLYAESRDKNKIKLALEYLEKVTKTDPSDWESIIDFAQVLEQNHPDKSLNEYNKAIELIQERGMEVRPEIYNNIGSLNIRRGRLDEAKKYLNEALERVKGDIDNGTGDLTYLKNIRNTVRFNIARLSEEMYSFDKALLLYKEILNDNSKYIDAYHRLGCIYRDKGQIYDASEWFKEALQIDAESPDAWTLIGNLHLQKEEWGPGQKKFERIIKSERSKDDAYALLALGNVWLQTTYQPTRDQVRLRRHQDRALKNYQNVLHRDEHNIYAANGIGAVLAHRGHVREARDIFSQVREATSDMADVWFNLAHIYVEQRQHTSAIQMYKNAMRTFHLESDPECLTYLARALFKSNNLAECKQCLIKARHVAPSDTVVLYNLALVMQQLAEKKLTDTKSNLKAVVGAVRDLELSQKYFEWLAENGDRMKFDLNGARKEAKNCIDILAQAPQFVARAKKIDDEENQFRSNTIKSMTSFAQRRKEREEARQRERADQQKALEMKRNEYRSKTKTVLEKVDTVPEKFARSESKPKKQRTGKRKGYEDDGLINDNESDAETGAVLKEKKRRKKRERTEVQDEIRERPGQYKSAAVVASDSSTDEDFNPNKKDSDDEGGADDDEKPTQTAMLSSSDDEGPSKTRMLSSDDDDDGGNATKKLESDSDDDSDTPAKKPKMASDSDSD